MSDGVIGSIGVSVVPDAENFWRRFVEQTRPGAVNAGRDLGRGVREGMQGELDRGVDLRVRADTAAARAELARLRAEIDRLGTARVGVRVDPNGAKQLNLLLTGALTLAPALIPIAGAAAALGAAFVGVGVAGIAAFKGIQAEMKAGTALGKQYGAGLAQLKIAAAGVERNAAQGFAISFDQIRAKIVKAGPELSFMLGRLSKETGRIASHLTGALVNGFTTFAPLMQHVVYYVDQLAAKFERWSTGPGGARFASALGTDFAKVLPALSQIGELVGRILAALNSYGLGVVGVFGLIAKTLNAIPLPVLSVLLTGIIGLRVAGVAALAVTKLVIGIEKLAVATSAIGLIRLPVFATGLGLLAKSIGGVAAGAVAAAFTINIASKATDRWTYSNNQLARATQQTFEGLNDLIHLNLSGAAAAFSGEKIHKYNIAVTEMADAIRHGREEQAAMNQVFAASRPPLPPAAIRRPGAVTAVAPIVDPIEIERLRLVSSNVDKLHLALAGLNAVQKSSNISTVIDSYDKYNKGLLTTIDNSHKFLSLGGETVFTYKGMSVGLNTYNAALKTSNGDVATATGLIEGQIDAQNSNVAALKRSAAQTLLLNKYVADSEARFGLTAAQVDIYSSALGFTVPKITASAAAEARYERALGLVSKALSNGNEAMQGWLTAQAAYNTSTKDITARADLLAAALTALRGVTLTMASANLTAVDNTAQLSKTLADNSASVGANGQLLGQLTKTAHGYAVTQPQLTAGSLAISSAMQQGATSAVDLAASIYKNTGNANNAFLAFQGLRGQFVQTAIQSGLTAKQAENLAAQIYGIPKDAKTFVALLGKHDVTAAIEDLTTKLSAFSKIIADALIIVTADTSQANAALNATINLANHAFAAVNLRGSGRAIADGAVMDYYANGGINKFADGAHVAQIAPAGAMRLWAEPETGGEAYIPLAMSKRGRSQKIMAEVAHRFGDAYQPRRYADGGTNAAPSKAGVTIDGPVALTGRLVIDDQGRGELVDAFIDLGNHLTYN